MKVSARWLYAAAAAGSLLGSVVTAASMSPAPAPTEGLAPAQRIERIPLDMAGVAGTCELTYLDDRLTEIECTPDEETP